MLTVTYTGDMDEDLDNDLKAVANYRGYELEGSGYSFITRTRDLRFIEKGDKEGSDELPK